ncbi:sulfite exporter TauE/SafE family protein [Geomesophilobacter sediminis]|uniref:Probable membrane transporter protein n=1 Tax=Geomesophilobacter sediminis TaxID=2798584 RepID=A0A8J7J484_9BACT|nr:sulfite exporter TauE/SafE family protein [Geomesophilobacter sediminis]MBJ6725593.1 sulfite exporter TauE/SafE family protein [Geomesophilobacter sediminis]
MHVAPIDLNSMLIIFAAGLWAGTQNTLAGGGSFITFPALLLVGLNPLAANMTSTIALFPMQITAALAGRSLLTDVGPVRFRHIFIVSIIGGIGGAFLLLNTPVSVFAHLVPWLVLFATSVFAWGSFRKKPLQATGHTPPWILLGAQALIAVYGGYFGGGIGFLMLAALTMAGVAIRGAAANKNFLAMAMNASAVAIFAFSSQINWWAVLALGAGGIGGGVIGGYLMHRVSEKGLRTFVVIVGGVLSIWLFVR